MKAPPSHVRMDGAAETHNASTTPEAGWDERAASSDPTDPVVKNSTAAPAAIRIPSHTARVPRRPGMTNAAIASTTPVANSGNAHRCAAS